MANSGSSLDLDDANDSRGDIEMEIDTCDEQLSEDVRSKAKTEVEELVQDLKPHFEAYVAASASFKHAVSIVLSKRFPDAKSMDAKRDIIGRALAQLLLSPDDLHVYSLSKKEIPPNDEKIRVNRKLVQDRVNKMYRSIKALAFPEKVSNDSQPLCGGEWSLLSGSVMCGKSDGKGDECEYTGDYCQVAVDSTDDLYVNGMPRRRRRGGQGQTRQ